MDLGINREVQVSIPMPSGYMQDPSRLQQMYNKSLGMVEGMCPPAPPAAPAPIDVQQQHNQGMGNMSSLSSMSMRAQQHPHHHQQQNSSSSVTIREHHQHQPQPLQIQYPLENNTSSVRNSGESKAVRYRECRKNHAASIGGYAVDGCGEFMPSGEDGTPAALKCAACNCHRNFHRREVEGEIGCECHQSARRMYMISE